MQTAQEVTLNTIPGSADDSRIAVVLTHQHGQSQIELHQQSWGEGIGWFTQSKVVLEPQQVTALSLGLGKSAVAEHTTLPNATACGWTPRIVGADSA